MKKKNNILAYSALFAAAFFVNVAFAADSNQSATQAKWGTDPKQVEHRLNALTTLLEKSSGAQKVAASGNQEAIALKGQAQSQRDQAQAAFKSGQYDEAKKYLAQASQTMFQAIRKADGGESGRQKDQNDFDQRLKSVKVLMEAHERVSKEKKRDQEVTGHIKTAMDAATKLRDGGQVKEGRVKLDEAYVIAKLGLEKLRRGDTLVRSLHFASKEEEYRYEIDRNDTHIMLVNMLLANKSDSVKRDANKNVVQADSLRKKAEAEAEKKQFEQAVTTLENSTNELVRAIRSAGVYIPG